MWIRTITQALLLSMLVVQVSFAQQSTDELRTAISAIESNRIKAVANAGRFDEYPAN